MNRLTVKDEFCYLPKDITGISCDDYCPGDCSTCLIQACFDKLGKLEDMEEQEAGKIKEPPHDAKEPTDRNVYWINDKGHIVATRLSSLETGRVGNTITYKGPTLYRSLREAKEALRKLREESG